MGSVWVIKRNGEEVEFDAEKISNAIQKANNEVTDDKKLTLLQIADVTRKVVERIEKASHAVNVERIQDLVEIAIMEEGGYEIAQKYVRYRYQREIARKANTTDAEILSLIECSNEEVNQENSNKDASINSTQRDYMAGQVSKDLTMRLLLPKEIVDAHNEGIIHFHDSDYYAQKEHNCDLINLEDMLQNGTVISETMIEKPHSFYTACNVTTQIVAQVASNQYGGQSFSLAHLAPFVDISRKKIYKEVETEFEENELEYEDECILRREVYASGKSRAFINDTPASLVQMKELGEQLIDVHSQHQNLLLNKEGFQLSVLDLLAHDEDELSKYRSLHREWKQVQQDLEQLVALAEKNKADED